jgi:hypothetical protein
VLILFFCACVSIDERREGSPCPASVDHEAVIVMTDSNYIVCQNGCSSSLAFDAYNMTSIPLVELAEQLRDTNPNRRKWRTNLQTGAPAEFCLDMEIGTRSESATTPSACCAGHGGFH